MKNASSFRRLKLLSQVAKTRRYKVTDNLQRKCLLQVAPHFFLLAFCKTFKVSNSVIFNSWYFPKKLEERQHYCSSQKRRQELLKEL